MKRLLLLALASLAFLCSWAQTDLTRYFLENAGFDAPLNYTASQTTAVKQEILPVEGWTSDVPADYTIVGCYEFGFQGTFNTATVPAAGYDGEAGGGLALSTGWNVTFKFYQTVTLPAGTYTLSAPTWNGCDKDAATSQLAWVPSTGTATKSSLTSYTPNDWTLDQITFTLTKTTKGKIQVGMMAPDGGSSKAAKIVIDYVRLTGTDVAIDKSTLASSLATATTLYGDGTGEGAAALKAVIDASQAVYDNAEATLLDVLGATKSLNDAVATYRHNNASEDNPIDYTTYIKEASFETGFTGWTVKDMHRQSNSSFTKKSGTYYVEKWVGQGNAVGDGSVAQTLSDLPLGRYRLTVAAQNLSQDQTSKKNTGAVIFADGEETLVQLAKDYTVRFVNLTGAPTIGFRAKGATGNWMALDDFRLALVGRLTASDIVTEIARQCDVADTLSLATMSDHAKAELLAAIAAARAITTESAEADMQSAVVALQNAVAEAKASTEVFGVLAEAIQRAETIESENADTMMSQSAREALAAALAAAKALTTATAEADVVAATTTLSTASDAVLASIGEYAALRERIKEAEALCDESLNGADDLLEAIAHATALSTNAEASSDDLAQEMNALARAMLAFHLANATPGTGTAPRVTATNHYVATGATQALVRATMTGSNILEKGVCWSTHHEPTVLDERTTKSFSLNGTIFHIKGMEPSKVYYVRPYAMNKTYTVSYGDEVKIVTHPMGTCTWSWNNGAPTAEANDRCRNAIKQTIDYFNEWTGIMGFKLSGSYGSGTPTADCGYGGSMRIGPSTAYQAIGTVLHETGHGVGVGTHWRWYNCTDTRESNGKSGRWLGREANDALHFLENNYNSDECFLKGDAVHGWGNNATYDWFVNGADKDKHYELQYIGGMTLLHGLFIDGLCPPTYANGVSGYTYNFDDDTRYYLLSRDAAASSADGLLYQRTTTAVAYKPLLQGEAIPDSAAWYMEYDAKRGYYLFRNAETGRYLTHTAGGASVTVKKLTGMAQQTELFQLMPDRTDLTIGIGSHKLTTHGYWFTWSTDGTKAMQTGTLSSKTGYGPISQATFDYSNNATKQQWIVVSENELEAYQAAALSTGIAPIAAGSSTLDGRQIEAIYRTDGTRTARTQRGVNIIRLADGSCRKIIVK